MPSPKRKRIPSFIKTGARVTFERPDSYDFDEGTLPGAGDLLGQHV